MARTGRRRGNVDTRADILAAARAQFAEQGYDGASLRGIARAAGVDPALVHHYFAGKSGLFAEVMQLPADPAAVLPAVLEVDAAELGATVLRFFLGLWEEPHSGPQMLTWIRSSLASEEGTARLREFVVGEVLRRIAGRLPDTRHAEQRAALAASQLIGLAIGRYLIRVPPLAAASVDELVAQVGPTLQRYLTGTLLPVDGPPQ